MSMLSVRLNNEDEEKLGQILAVMQVEKSDLVRKLITDQWLALQGEKTFVERAGGHPKHLLRGPGNLSARDVRKAEVANYREVKLGRGKRSS